MYLCYVSHFNKSYHIIGARVFQELEEAVSYMKEVTKEWSCPLDDEFVAKNKLSMMPVHIPGEDYEMLGHVQKVEWDKDITIYTQAQEIKVIPKEAQEK